MTGEIAGGYVGPSQLPRATTGSLTLDGAALPVAYSSISDPYPHDPQATLYPSIALNTALGQIRVSVLPEQPADSTLSLIHVNNAQVLYSARLGAAALASTATGYTLTLNSQALRTGGNGAQLSTLRAAINVGRPTGALAISGQADFSPLAGTTSGASEELMTSWPGPTSARWPASASTVCSAPAVNKRLRQALQRLLRCGPRPRRRSSSSPVPCSLISIL